MDTIVKLTTDCSISIYANIAGREKFTTKGVCGGIDCKICIYAIQVPIFRCEHADIYL